ncbi:unnamed protein product [Paramecium octaurelia]|uniref:Casein kinase I n=1 Tax=Paramecium octaurelia TaxID=43137 RepID=A0A8S1WQT0_PAROT|nr:unnamed protein product [Paramecium octaurelia]
MTRHSQIINTHKTISSVDDLPGLTIHEKLFKGGYGTIFRGVDHTTKQEIAIKYSKFDLSNEYKIMKKLSHIPGIPKAYSLGEQSKSTYLSMEYLNSDLHTIRAKLKQLSLKCICCIAIKVLEILKEVHALNIVHRDIKPTNLMIKSLEDSQIYLIDFGIAKEADQFGYTEEVEGTLLYDPLQVHRRLPYRFIDDIEMLAYTLVFLYKGHLPWMKYPNNILYNEEVMRHKESYLSSKTMSRLPFAELFGYIKWNQNVNKPNHDFLISLFKKILADNKMLENYLYDWVENITPLTSSKTKTTISIFNYFCDENEHSQTDLSDDEESQGVFTLTQQVYKFLQRNDII